jgi:hypothetical protein
MSDEIRESSHERKVRFHGDAPFAKHDYRYRSRDVIRMAGKVWAESPRERQFRLAKTRSLAKSRETPVGLGFSEKDEFGPDNSYNSIQSLNSTPGPESYMFR